ncbi:MAG: hypothetical protein JRI97_03290 [Deltaproteobacteria bacterium]|nr:hypothetical protein [Deltaproteobacteria bacterium]
MSDQEVPRKKRRLPLWAAVAMVLVLAAGGLVAVLLRPHQAPPPEPAPASKAARRKPEPKPAKVVDYENPGDAALMDQRKERYGIDQSLDMVISEDEAFVLGGEQVAMRDITEKIRLADMEILEESLEGAPDLPLASDEFGLHVVREGDNIWNIHFRLLQEYFASRGVTLSPMADEPMPEGYSSGVGKILKFSENMVHIYNLKTKALDEDLNLIQPNSKVVVYNMNRVFALLSKIDTDEVEHVRFDGDTLWIPAGN